MMTASERAIQKSTSRPRRSVHHASFLWDVFREQQNGTLVQLRAGAGPLFRGKRAVLDKARNTLSLYLLQCT
jgi:hypothetical protein